ncbi:MAG: hypothetical protein RQ885_12055 [Desulfurococcales archaeon]|nr:hypothetical protein [Desulfurococcales archaeon]
MNPTRDITIIDALLRKVINPILLRTSRGDIINVIASRNIQKGWALARIEKIPRSRRSHKDPLIKYLIVNRTKAG